MLGHRTADVRLDKNGVVKSTRMGSMLQRVRVTVTGRNPRPCVNLAPPALEERKAVRLTLWWVLFHALAQFPLFHLHADRATHDESERAAGSSLFLSERHGMACMTSPPPSCTAVHAALTNARAVVVATSAVVPLHCHWQKCIAAASERRLEKSYARLHCMAQHGMAQHSMAQHGTAWHSTARHSTAWHSTAWHSMAWHSTARHGTAWHGTARHGTARHGTARHGTARHGTARHGKE
eukprot:365643-Chlamydomonas_euryale.AAC.18